MKWNPDEGFPHFTPMATVDADCPLCHRHIRFPAKSVADAEAKHWQGRYAALMGKMNDVLERCTRLHGYNPVERWRAEEMIKIRDQMKGWE